MTREDLDVLTIEAPMAEQECNASSGLHINPVTGDEHECTRTPTHVMVHRCNEKLDFVCSVVVENYAAVVNCNAEHPGLISCEHHKPADEVYTLIALGPTL